MTKKDDWIWCQYYEEYLIPRISPNPDDHCNVCGFDCEKKFEEK